MNNFSPVVLRIAIGCVTLFLGGCGGAYVVNSVYKSQSLPEIDGKGAKPERSMYVAGKPMIDTGSDGFENAFKAAKTTATARNALIIRIRLVSDEVCKQHLGDIRGNSTALNLTFGSLTTLFSALASLETGTAAKTLAASAGFSNASRSLVNEELYRQAFADAIIRAISSDRKDRSNVIEAGMKISGSNDSPGGYSIEQGILDLQDYHDRCSFMNGVGLLSKAIEKRGASREDILAMIAAKQNLIDQNEAKIKGASESGKAELIEYNNTLTAEIKRLGALLSTVTD